MNERPSDLLGKSKLTVAALFNAGSGSKSRSLIIFACEMAVCNVTFCDEVGGAAVVCFFEAKQNHKEVRAGAGSQPVVLTTLW